MKQNSSYQIPFALRIEKFGKHFVSKLRTFTNGKVRFNIIWNTHKTQSLFKNKDKVQHISRIIFEGVCSCGADYIGETICNVNMGWNKHKSQIDKNSECTKHLQEHFNHELQLSLLSTAPWNILKQKI